MTEQSQIPFLHPELSLLSFNERVLNMAVNTDVPALERLKFLCIFSSNMDEFFEIRVSGLLAKANTAFATEGVDGMVPSTALEKISEHAHRLSDLQYQTLNKHVMPALAEHGIRFLERDQWNEEQKKWLKTYFKREVLPILTPIRLDPAHPFPLTINKGLSIVADLHDPERDEAHNIAVVPAPRALPRYIRLPEELCECTYEYVYLSAIISANIKRLFNNVKVLGCYQFRITRNSDLYVDLEEVEDLAHTLEGELPSRLYGEAIRLEVSDTCPKRIINLLKSHFQIDEDLVYRVNGPVNLNRLIGLADRINRPQIKYPAFVPSSPDILNSQNNIFETLTHGDVLLHHPFQSFAPVVDLLRQAAQDPNVLAIKQTLYRTGAESVLVEHLIDAARAGKEVTVVVELMARFDEQNNLTTAQLLQAAGAHVVYGMVGKKTHAKMLMIVRREGKHLKRYVHLGTGNYHQGNTRAYTDYGLLTNQNEICSDVHELFLQLTTQSANHTLKKLHQSPYGISDLLLERIQKEAQNASANKPAKIIVKVNGLSSTTLINALYEASQAGVEIKLIVRGICCLRPGLTGISENIEVRSIVGRFLEHDRVFYFENGDKDSELFISSADLMLRNLSNRIEQCVPIEDPRIKETLFKQLNYYLKDNTNASLLQADGSYIKVEIDDKHEDKFCAQEQLLKDYSEER